MCGMKVKLQSLLAKFESIDAELMMVNLPVQRQTTVIGKSKHRNRYKEHSESIVFSV